MIKGPVQAPVQMPKTRTQFATRTRKSSASERVCTTAEKSFKQQRELSEKLSSRTPFLHSCYTPIPLCLQSDAQLALRVR